MSKVANLFMDRCSEWANNLNELYSVNTDDEEIADQVWKYDDLMLELKENSFTDTCAREKMMNAICQERIGMDPPMYGDTDQYKKDFETAMSEWYENQKA